MNSTLERLQEKHPSISYLSYKYTKTDSILRINYNFSLEPGIYFNPVIEMPFQQEIDNDSLLDRLVFLNGIIELISYWKLTCSPLIKIECGDLDEYELKWWESLYRNGLGEFFFINKISPHIPFSIESIKDPVPQARNLHTNFKPEDANSALILVGGGKDSIVTLELIKEYSKNNLINPIPVCLNPTQASLDTIKVYGLNNPLSINRSIDKKLIELNKSGYLNGHTPFSALLSFTTTILALGNNAKEILSSNESSASEGNLYYEGLEINHQYSKSFEYESKFREYSDYIGIPISYYSALRPLNEIQITAIFSKYSDYFKFFKSCNRTQTMQARKDSSTPNWCGSCPKCLFTFLCLGSFLSIEQLIQIFGSLIVLDPKNKSIIKNLCGFGENKPFECVGTSEESILGLYNFIKNYKDFSNKVPGILNELEEYIPKNINKLNNLLSAWNSDNFLPENLENLIKQKVHSIQY